MDRYRGDLEGERERERERESGEGEWSKRSEEKVGCVKYRMKERRPSHQGSELRHFSLV